MHLHARVELADVLLGEQQMVRADLGAEEPSVLLGGRDVTGQAVNLLPGSPQISLVYKSATGKVAGTIDKCNGVVVVLVPQQTVGLTYGRMTPCQPALRCVAKNVMPVRGIRK